MNEHSPIREMVRGPSESSVHIGVITFDVRLAMRVFDGEEVFGLEIEPRIDMPADLSLRQLLEVREAVVGCAQAMEMRANVDEH